jgi:sulfite exporter TauE/SafE
MNGALLLSALAMGLLGSTHCVVMCGGVVGVLSGGLVQLESSGRRSNTRRLRFALAYNAGRIASYAVAGTVAGTFGALVGAIPALHGAALGLRLAAGALMLGVGLYLTGVLRGFAVVERLGAPLWRRLEPTARRLLMARSTGAALGLGALWGWMPCGLVYAALAAALVAGAPAAGALVMVAFGLGTLPTLLAMSAVAARVADATRRPWVRRVAGAAIVAFGIMHVAAASAQITSHDTTAGRHCCAGHHGGEP